MTNCIYLAWEDQSTRRWHVIGQLSRTDKEYEFRYTLGIKNIFSFPGLSNMPEHDKVYRSPELFSLFRSRVMPKSRPDYADYMSWMAVSHEGNVVDELDILAISGGERETDFFRMIPIAEKNTKGNYAFKFFANGLSDMPSYAKERVQSLHKGDRLYLAHDFQNKENLLALFLRTDDPPCLIGYVPAYFAKIIHKMKNEESKEQNKIQICVVQVNENAPMQMRLLCELSSSLLAKPWQEYDDEFKLISS